MNSKYIKYPLILLIVAGFCAAAIAATYLYTQPILDERQAKTTKINLNKLYNNVDKYSIMFDEKALSDSTLLKVYELVLKDNTKVVVYETSSKGKNGAIISLIAFKGSKIDQIKNIIHNETPGIGARIDESDYLAKIKKQNISDMNVETIAGATYSSTALKKSIDAAVTHYTKEVAK